MLTSYSISARILSFAAWRFCEIRTRRERKIASRETISVSRPNGNGSTCLSGGGSVLTAIHITNQRPFNIRKCMLPLNHAIQSKKRSEEHTSELQTLFG